MTQMMSGLVTWSLPSIHVRWFSFLNQYLKSWELNSPVPFTSFDVLSIAFFAPCSRLPAYSPRCGRPRNRSRGHELLHLAAPQEVGGVPRQVPEGEDRDELSDLLGDEVVHRVFEHDPVAPFVDA